MAAEKLTRDTLMGLEQYAEERTEFRRKVMAHKAKRRAHIGDNATFIFEDRLTMQYQVQEMLRIERIFEAAGIEEELGAYNPLIPDGDNWKATFQVEFDDPKERAERLTQLIGIEDRVWVRAGVDGERVYAIADEDLDRATEEKTSAVHFLRFQLDASFIQALKGGAVLAMGIDHANYDHALEPVPDHLRESLLADLD
ncbi:MAG: DUF3501 family protein [Pseudomonadota bacterium]